MAYALTGREDFLRENRSGLLLSVLAHLAVLAIVSLNLEIMPRRPPQPVRLAIQATVVDARAMRQRAADAERAARAAEQRRLQQENERRQQAQQRERDEQARKERQAAEERQQRERQQAEQRNQREQTAQKRRAEAQRKQEAEKARQAQAEQQRQKAEAQEKAAAQARRKAEEARRQAELQELIDEEEGRNAAADSGMLGEYVELIRQKVERNWIRPASAREGISCAVLVTQMPGGEVVEARVTECNGDAAVARSIETAVLRSSPLPLPSDPRLFERSLRFEFRPRD